MRLIPRSRLAAVGLAAVFAAGLVGTAGIALADDAPVPGVEQIRKHIRRHRLAAVGVRQMVEASGLDPAVVREGLQSGESLATVFEANGVDTAAVIDQVLADFRTTLDEKVEAGAITPERADAVYARAAEALPRLAEAEGRRHRHPVLRHEIRIAADTIGVSAEDLVAALRAGDTIGAFAQANGVSADAVISAMVAPINDRIDRAEARGGISPERAEELKAAALQRVTALVTEGFAGRHRADGS